jgi:hypothetical protein
MISFKKINIPNLKINLALNISRYNHTHFTDYDKMIRNMKALRNKMDGCLKEKYIFKYQQNLNLEGHNNKYIVDKYTFSIIHNNHNKYINYCNYNYNLNNKINQIIIYEDFNKMLETMKMKKIEFHQFTTNYLINTKYSFINLTYHHKSENKDKDNEIFISGRLIDKIKSNDAYNIIITNEMKVLENN